MKVTRKKPRAVYVPVNVELETEEELDNLIHSLNRGCNVTLTQYCKRSNDLDVDRLDAWNYKLWDKLNNMKEDC